MQFYDEAPRPGKQKQKQSDFQGIWCYLSGLSKPETVAILINATMKPEAHTPPRDTVRSIYCCTNKSNCTLFVAIKPLAIFLFHFNF